MSREGDCNELGGNLNGNAFRSHTIGNPTFIRTTYEPKQKEVWLHGLAAENPPGLPVDAGVWSGPAQS